MLPKFALIIAIALCEIPVLVPTIAVADDCKSVADPTARLACFDKAPAKSPPKQMVSDPATETAKRAIIATKSRLFTDADSLKDVAIGKPFTCLSGNGTCVCIEANGKTPSGGYSGIQLLLVRIKGPAETEMIGDASAPGLCDKLTPFPQMNGKR